MITGLQQNGHPKRSVHMTCQSNQTSRHLSSDILLQEDGGISLTCIKTHVSASIIYERGRGLTFPHRKTRGLDQGPCGYRISHPRRGMKPSCIINDANSSSRPNKCVQCGAAWRVGENERLAQNAFLSRTRRTGNQLSLMYYAYFHAGA